MVSFMTKSELAEQNKCGFASNCEELVKEFFDSKVDSKVLRKARRAFDQLVIRQESHKYGDSVEKYFIVDDIKGPAYFWTRSGNTYYFGVESKFYYWSLIEIKLLLYAFFKNKLEKESYRIK